MDEAEQHCFQKTPKVTNANQSQAQNNNISVSSPSFSSQPATPTRRIIKQIPLDYNKLKQAGLHVKLAEALSKQNASATKNIATATATSSSTSAKSAAASASAGALPAATTSATFAQRQPHRERQIASMSTGNEKPLTSAEQSFQIKSLIKSRILNKSSKSQVHQQQHTTTATTRSPITEASGIKKPPGGGGGFTVPIAKADLSARSKPPFLLNMVNKLPKQRAMGEIVLAQPTRQQQPPVRAMAAASARAAAPQPPARAPASQSAPVAVTTHPPPLIVLENKVLAPDEKIDLRALRLPNGQPAALPQTAPAVKDMRNADKPKASTKKPTELAKEVLSQLPASSSNATNKKTILNVNKLKVGGREEIAQLAKEVRKKAMQHVQQQQQQHNTDIPAIKTMPAQSLDSSNIKTQMSKTDVHSTSLITPITRDSTNPIASSPSQMASKNVIKSAPPIKNNVRTPITPSVKAFPKTMSSPSSTNNQSNQPSTAEEPSDMTASPVKSHELSAVDFIAQLTADDSVDPTNYMELSPEELSMSAKFTCSKTSTSQPAICSKPEDDLPIGKILQMEEMDILHATLNVNVNGNKSNVLCISPNAIKLQNSARSEDIECHQPVNDNNEKDTSAGSSTPLKLVTPKHVYTNVNRKSILSKPPSLVVTAPTKDEVPEKQVVEVNKPHVEQMCDKEESQPAKPLSYRPKKGKINLVQRNKRASVSKPTENIVEKVAEQPVQMSDTEISSDLSEAPRDPTSKLADNKEQPKRANVSKPNEIIAKKVTEEAVFDKATTSKQADNEKQTKRAGVSKPNKSIAEKVIEEPHLPDTEIPTNLIEVTKETALDKDPTSIRTENKEQTKGATISEPNEIIDKQITEKTAQVLDKGIPSDLTEALKKTELHKDTASKRADTGEQEANIKPAEKSEKNELGTAKAEREKIEAVVKATTDKIVISNETEHVIREETADVGSSISNPVQVNLSKERDLSQLYHPPKLPKNKQKVPNKEQLPASAPTTSVSLLEVLTQEQPPPQGEPQLPFRSGEPEAKKLKTMDNNFADALGIQNLLTHLAAENIVPQSKEVLSEETAKTPRKKLLKTRPVLNAKRSTKESKARKRPLPADGKANGTQRMATSSTSDDNGDSFHGFDDEASRRKRDRHSKGRETDISDDATPDYDETEEEPQPDIQVQAKKAKHETAVQTINKNKTIAKVVEDNAENPENGAPLNPAPNVKEQSLIEKPSTEIPPVQKQETEKKSKRPRQSGGKAKEKSKPIMESSAQPNINSSTEIGEVLNSVEPETSSIGNEEQVIAKKKRGRPRKVAVMSDAAQPMDTSAEFATPKANCDSSSLPQDDTSTPTPKRRGRKPKPKPILTAKNVTIKSNEEKAEDSQRENEFYTRLLLIRKREQLESGEELREEGRGEGDQQCGLCLVRCDTADWQLHLEEHYGVGWLISEPAPVLTRTVVFKMMKSYADATNKLFTCRLCQRSLKSTLGILTHLQGCGSNQRIECEHCKNTYTKLSYLAHYRSCAKREGQLTEDEQLDKLAPDQPVYSNAGRAKRKSTLKAETKLEKIAEDISPQDDKEFDGDASDYDVGTDKESSDSDESEGVDSNEEDQELKSPIKKETKILYGRTNAKSIADDRWKYFARVNYSKSVLYPHLLPRYEQMLTADAKRLLPSKESTSMRYAYDKVDDNDWMQLAPLQGFNTEYEHICYLGNAVKELAWVPLPPTVEAQYLLCSRRNKVLSFARQFKNRHDDELLLLFECKESPDSDDNVWPMQTRLHYGICVPQQAVHSFAFMPSGGFDEPANRLALLAVGSSSGVVIYALPLRLTDESQVDIVIVLQPVLTLTLDIDNPIRDPCTKICWSEASGHNLLVSGYASGNVAFYDIGDDQGLNCIERNNHRYFLPASFFFFGERNIYYLELHYDTNGARWLAVGTTMRKLCIYDIANYSFPLPIVCDPIVNLFLGCAYWPPAWESLAVGATEVYKQNFPRLVTLNPTGICFNHASMDLLLSSPRAVHFNWEQMLLVTVTDNGDVVFIKCPHYNFETLVNKRTKVYRTVSTTEARYLIGNTAPDCITPDEFKQDFGLVINTLHNVSNTNKSDYLNLKRRPNFDLSNLLRLNCVRWNWNVRACNWLAVGAEHGLLRIIKYGPEKDFCCN